MSPLLSIFFFSGGTFIVFVCFIVNRFPFFSNSFQFFLHIFFFLCTDFSLLVKNIILIFHSPLILTISGPDLFFFFSFKLHLKSQILATVLSNNSNHLKQQHM